MHEGTDIPPLKERSSIAARAARFSMVCVALLFLGAGSFWTVTEIGGLKIESLPLPGGNSPYSGINWHGRTSAAAKFRRSGWRARTDCFRLTTYRTAVRRMLCLLVRSH